MAVWDKVVAVGMERNGRSVGVKQRNFEQDWNAVSDVEEGCFLSPAQGNGLCELTSAQPHKCCMASGEPVSLSALRSLSGEVTDLASQPWGAHSAPGSRA